MSPPGHREPPLPVAYGEALARLLAAVRPVEGTEVTSLPRLDGRVAAEEVRAPRDLPPSDMSAMDGYGLRSADTRAASRERPVLLHLFGSVFAGKAFTTEVPAGACVAITTGGVLPPAADGVVRLEDCERVVDRDRGIAHVKLTAPVTAGADVLRRGSDVEAGALLVAPGALFTPGRIALLAGSGAASGTVYRRPEVAILPTGDELVEAGNPAGPAQVHVSNAFGIAALVGEAGGSPHVARPVKDDLTALEQTIDAALATSDIVVVIGGTWLGEHDLVADVLGGMGELLFHGVRARPGHTALAARCGEKLVVGLPGSPGGSVVTAAVLLDPVVRRAARTGARSRPREAVQLRAAIPGPMDEDRFILVEVRDGWGTPVTGRGVGGTRLAQAAGYLHLPAGAGPVPAESRVELVRL